MRSAAAAAAAAAAGRPPAGGTAALWLASATVAEPGVERHAAVGDEREEAAQRLRRLPGGAVDLRPDGAGGDAIDADPARGDLLGEALHHQHDAALGGRVVGVPGPGYDLVHRAHADDLPRRGRARGVAALQVEGPDGL